MQEACGVVIGSGLTQALMRQVGETHPVHVRCLARAHEALHVELRARPGAPPRADLEHLRRAGLGDEHGAGLRREQVALRQLGGQVELRVQLERSRLGACWRGRHASGGAGRHQVSKGTWGNIPLPFLPPSFSPPCALVTAGGENGGMGATLELQGEATRLRLAGEGRFRELSATGCPSTHADTAPRTAQRAQGAEASVSTSCELRGEAKHAPGAGEREHPWMSTRLTQLRVPCGSAARGRTATA